MTPGVIGYGRVSTDEQAVSGLGLEAQRRAVDEECERRALPLLAFYEDAGVSARTLDRPALRRALQALSEGNGTVLMASKLDRLTRSTKDMYGLMEQSRSEGWALVMLDLSVDTSTPNGEAMAGMSSVFAQLERRLISQRTRDALAVKKAQGVQLGRPRTVPEDVRAAIVALRESGMTWTALADHLNDIGTPTGQGGARWHANTVRRIYIAEKGPANV